MGEAVIIDPADPEVAGFVRAMKLGVGVLDVVIKEGESGPNPELLSTVLENPELVDPDTVAIFIGAIVEVAEVGKEVVKPDELFGGTNIPGDSLTVLEILEIVQDKTDTDLPTEAFDAVTTVGQAYIIARGLIEKKRQSRGDGPEAGDREPRNSGPNAPAGSIEEQVPKA